MSRHRDGAVKRLQTEPCGNHLWFIYLPLHSANRLGSDYLRCPKKDVNLVIFPNYSCDPVYCSSSFSQREVVRCYSNLTVVYSNLIQAAKRQRNQTNHECLIHVSVKTGVSSSIPVSSSLDSSYVELFWTWVAIYFPLKHGLLEVHAQSAWSSTLLILGERHCLYILIASNISSRHFCSEQIPTFRYKIESKYKKEDRHIYNWYL